MVYVPDRKHKAGTAWFLVSCFKFNRVVRASRYKVRSDAIMVPDYRIRRRYWRSFAVEIKTKLDNGPGAGTVGV
jgi:hypothetical protein